METEVENQCFRTALRLLGRRDHSAAELAQKLKSRGFRHTTINAVLEECKRLNYLDDERFYVTYSRTLQAKGFGALRVQQMLRSKGVAEELIAPADDDRFSFEAQCTQCRQAVVKKLKTKSLQDVPSVLKPKLYRFLLGRGFAGEVIHRILDEVQAETGEHPVGG